MIQLIRSKVTLACHNAIKLASKSEKRRFMLASKDARKVQLNILKRIIGKTQGTDSQKIHGSENVVDYSSFCQHFPVTDYIDWSSLIEKQRSGENGVLTNEVCVRYQPTSGSTSAIKWVPYTPEFLKQLNRAVGPWVSDLYERYPNIKKGKHYWSLSWVPTDLRGGDSSNLNDDLKLLPWWKRWFMSTTMAVPEQTSLAETSEESMFATICYLVACENLSFISVWSPTFILSLLDYLKDNKLSIVTTLKTAQWPIKHTSLKSMKVPKNTKVANLLESWDKELDADFTYKLWPDLALISAWDTASSEVWAKKLKRIFAHAEFQGKGLWATEGVFTIPFEGVFPLAINSHFYEFEDLETHQILPSWQLEVGMKVKPIVSTASGLMRYAMKDRLEVVEYMNDLPCFQFLGRIDGVDMVGEKVSSQIATSILSDVNKMFSFIPVTLLGVPKNSKGKSRYVMLCESSGCRIETEFEPILGEIQSYVEARLIENFHYQLARDLGQLDVVQVVIMKDARKFYENKKVDQGMTRGNIKIESLCYWSNSDDFVDFELAGEEQPYVI